MKYSLEIPPVIRTGRSRLISSSQLDEDQYMAIREMLCYQGFIDELIQDNSPRKLVDACKSNYDIARNSAIALGVDVTGFPKHLRPNSQNRRQAA